MKKKDNTVILYTPEGEELIKQQKVFVPWNEYPRPRMERDSFLCLNGEWDFCTCGVDEKPTYGEKILVPFVPESVLSGIGREMPSGKKLCYRRELEIPEGFINKRVILHIGAADQIAEVLLSGKSIGRHVGGYGEISIDLTEHLEEKNTLEVYVTDELDNKILPYGKQCRKRGGMWYTPVSGIWQTVWLESLPERYVADIKVKTDLEGADVYVTMSDGRAAEGRLTLEDKTFDIKNGHVRVTPDEIKLWSPETPHLYHFTVETEGDSVRSYFALRTLECRKVNDVPRLCLNGKPYFFHGLLDQGYFSDGIFLPATPSGFERDILAAKRLGFNMLRKHIKIEPERFYYDCDRLGIAVFQDMVNNSDYSFIRDTALPTVGMKSLNDKKLHKDKKTREAFLSAMDETVERLSFHPSVVYWTIFNEGWGQFDHASAYERLRRIDDSRIIDSVSGWFTPKKADELKSDVCSFHVYFKPVRLKKADLKPIVLSEFGGYSLKVEGHTFNLKDNYGYSTMKSGGEFEAALEKLYLGEVMTAIKESGLSAAVYTQLTDVEDETNGLLTYDRRVTKVSEERMQKIASALYEAGNN